MARWISSARRVGFGSGAERDGEHGDFQVLPHVVPEGRHADVGGLQRGDPDHFLDAVLNLALVGGGGRALFQQQLLGHALVHAGIRWKGQGVDDRGETHALALPPGSTTRKATTSKSLMPWNSPFMAWVPPGVNRLATARSSFLPTMEATALASRS